WIAVILLSVTLVEITTSLMSGVFNVIPRSSFQWGVTGCIILTGIGAVLYGTVRSLYQLIYYARHNQNIPVLDKFMHIIISVLGSVQSLHQHQAIQHRSTHGFHSVFHCWMLGFVLYHSHCEKIF
ncbi:unnamed protein product, partial [Auanema sp. JU1783]